MDAVENGGFFTGMYLIAAADRYRQNPTAENREKVKRLAGGLYRLQDVGKTPGFIARGIGTDGECHYAASSNDQVFPWFLGLWSYWNTDIPTDAERAECAGRMAVSPGNSRRSTGSFRAICRISPAAGGSGKISARRSTSPQ